MSKRAKTKIHSSGFIPVIDLTVAKTCEICLRDLESIDSAMNMAAKRIKETMGKTGVSCHIEWISDTDRKIGRFYVVSSFDPKK